MGKVIVLEAPAVIGYEEYPDRPTTHGAIGGHCSDRRPPKV